jgi:hypothetical protein
MCQEIAVLDPGQVESDLAEQCDRPYKAAEAVIAGIVVLSLLFDPLLPGEGILICAHRISRHPGLRVDLHLP